MCSICSTAPGDDHDRPVGLPQQLLGDASERAAQPPDAACADDDLARPAQPGLPDQRLGGLPINELRLDHGALDIPVRGSAEHLV